MSTALATLAANPLFTDPALDDAKVRSAMPQLLADCQAAGVSDLHLSAQARPFVRRHGQIHYLTEQPLPADVAEAANLALLDEEQFKQLQETSDLELALAFGNSQRFRACITIHKWGVAGAYRIVPPQARPLDALGYPDLDVLRRLLAFHNGLILVTGPVNSGKTATLAAMVDEVNRNRSDHIITVEDPIEYVLPSDQCIVTQRQIGDHTKTFSSALKAALRQDPDVIAIGELRDLETINIAITAAETGHLVLGTMHTADAASTLSRLLDVFPPAQQAQIRAMVSESLRGILCQKLLPAVDGGNVLATEILVANLAVGNLIRENKLQNLASVMETGVRDGMLTMDSSVLALYREGRITLETALDNIGNRALRALLENAADASAAPAPPEAAAPAAKKRFGLF
ncbi:MAG TPA: PilT/PilU family type 4a pilus ATPase [Opitutaceae bacterium]|nr:PilT/PilU family type 4a pilus ATPase [Opitutaceae bacterium]